MKKYFPVLAISTLLIGFFLTQVVFNLEDLSAVPARSDKKALAQYESLFRKLTLEDRSGKKHKLSKIKEPIVILNFWASWCQPCLEEFPSLVEMYKKLSKKGVEVIGINSDEEKISKNIKKTVKKFKLNFPIVSKNSSTILEKFKITSIPVTLIFYKGKVIEVSNGAKDFNSVETIEKFKKLISKK